MTSEAMHNEESRTDDPWYVIVVEITDDGDRRRSDRPFLYVGLTIVEPELRVEQIRRGKGPEWLAMRAVALRHDLMDSGDHLSRACAQEAVQELIASLESDGYTINLRNTPVWSVYIIQLDEDHCEDSGKGWVYVGETSKTPEVRLLQHKAGRSDNPSNPSSSKVFKYGLHLREDLMRDLPSLYSRDASKLAESQLAEQLRSQGYRVAGGH